MKVLCTSQIGASTALGQTMRVLAIAKALQHHGDQLKFLAGDKLTSVINNQGIAVIPLPAMPEVAWPLNAEQMKDQPYREELLAKIKKSLELAYETEKKAIISEKPDVMVCGNPTGIFSAKNAGIPCVFTMLQPHGKKTLSSFTTKIAADENFRKQIANVFSSFLQEKPGGNTSNLFLEALEAISLILLEGMPEISGDADLLSLGDWVDKVKNKIQYTGPLLAQIPDDLPDQEELKLLYTRNKDKPVVYVTIGGGTSLIGADFISLVLEMFRELPEVNGIISTGLAISPEILAGYNPPNNAIIHSFVPGTEMVKASDVTVFHGGSSTLMTCIACGKPAVIIPSIGEQEDNGAVFSQKGAGVVLNKQDLTPGILKEAVQKILSDPSFRNNAQNLKGLGERYGGATGAATMIKELVNGRKLVGASTHSGSR